MAEQFLAIDGSEGEGGGQILRSSLALSLVTGRPMVIEKIRAKRKKPGLMRQHLTAVAAAAEVGHAQTEGAHLGSLRLVFRPGRTEPGNYVFRVGTAGSATLVLQTVLPALMVADGESTLTLEGGTHNPWAPPFDFLAHAYLPIVNRLGPLVQAQLVRPGFYPAGGGEMTVHVRPSRQLFPLQLLQRGEVRARRVRALVARLPRHIAQRECRTIQEQTGWEDDCFSVEEVTDSRGPGNAVTIELESDPVTEVFTGFGQLGVKAEEVAAASLREAQAYLEAGVPVGTHLADQLMLPLGIAAWQGAGSSRFRTMTLSLHATTHLEILRRFLEIDLEVECIDPNDCLVRIG